MAKITLHSENTTSTTSVSNTFIDEFMTEANGEFVKIYLYLLRLMNAPDAAFSISAIADKFEHTEKDIKRALSYWERMHLLRLEYDAQQNLTGVYFTDTAAQKAVTDSSTGFMPLSKEPVSAVAVPPQKRVYTANDIQQFCQDETVAELLFIAERYLGRTLSATDTNSILYWYDVLGMKSELIEYLIEYCVSKNHTSIRYIEKVALVWCENGITTVAQAKEHAGMHSQSYFAVMKALGISGRNLVPSETSLINKWQSGYGFSLELITAACQRTILAIHQPSFEYTDSILQNWQKNKVATLADVAALDARHQKKKETTAPATPAKNNFNNIKQRNYDYDQLEQMLLTTSVH